MSGRQAHRLCLPLPLYHIFASGGVVASAVHPGTCLVFPSPTWAASETVKAIQKEKYIHTHTHKMCCIERMHKTSRRKVYFHGFFHECFILIFFLKMSLYRYLWTSYCTFFYDLAFRCSVLYGTPTMFGDILNLPDLREYDVSSLKTTLMAGAPCPVHLAKSVVDHLKIKYFVVFAYVLFSTVFYKLFNCFTSLAL